MPRSASDRDAPACSRRATSAVCHVAPLAARRQRPSMMSSRRPISASSTSHFRSPSAASGSSLRTTSSATRTCPTCGQYTSALIPRRIPATKFSLAAWNDIWVQIGRSSLASARTSPAKKAALAMVSTTVGPAGSTRFSTRRCGLAAADVVDRAGSSGRRCRCAAAARPARYSAAVQHGDRILVGADRQQGREVPRVLLEQVEDRGDPALAEPDPRAYALGLQLFAAGVGALLEQRDPGLGDQLLGRTGTASWLRRPPGCRRSPGRRSSSRRSRRG